MLGSGKYKWAKRCGIKVKLKPIAQNTCKFYNLNYCLVGLPIIYLKRLNLLSLILSNLI